jgi:hypothetical protein
MTTFLNWLYASAARVYYWFGDQYNNAVQVAQYAYAWSVSFADNAYWQARTVAAAWVENVMSFARAVEQELFAWVNSLLNTLNIAIQGVYDWVRPWLDMIRQELRQWIDIVRSEAASLTAWIVPWITSGLVSVRDDLLALIAGKIASLRADMANMITASQGSPFGNLSGWIANVNHLYDALIVFASNPPAFIYGMLWDKFLDWLSFRLAYALGTEKEPLPNIPGWSE